MNHFDVEFAEITITPEQIATLRANAAEPYPWLVNVNVPGYLPDYDANEFSDFNAAAEMALDVIDELVHWNSDYTYDATPLIDAQNSNTPGEFEINLVNGYGQIEQVVSLTRAIN